MPFCHNQGEYVLQSKSMVRPAALRKLLITTMILACHSVAVLAAPDVRIDIAAQPLSSALRDLASQAGVQLAFAAEAVGAAKARAIKGEMSVDAALRKLLVGSGLEFRKDGERSYVVVKSAEIEHGLAEVVVTATRTERRVDEVPASVTVITAKDIARQQPRQITDLLRNIEGVDVAGYGSPTTLPVFRIRGIGSSFGGQTSQALIDGMPIESPIAGIHSGLLAIDMNDLSRVEVLRGPASALYGPGVVGGIVNFVPKRWQGSPGAEIDIGAGSHGATKVYAAVGGAWDVIDFRLSASDYQTDGFVARNTPDPWGTKDLARRDGQDKKFGLTLGIRPAENQEITLAARTGEAKGAWLGGHPNYRNNNSAESYDIGYRLEASENAVFKLRYRNTRQKAHLLFDDEYVNGNSGNLALAEIDDREESAQHFDAQADLRFFQGNMLTVGASYGTAKYTTRDYDVLSASSNVSSVKSKITGVFVQDEHRFSEHLTSYIGGRWDHYQFSDDIRNGVVIGSPAQDSVFNPRLGARYRFNEATSVYATVGTAYVPALSSLRYRSSAAWLSNPGLKPETSTTYEAGINHRQGPWAARAALFRTDYEEMITSISVGSKRQFQNIGKVEVNGIELALEGSFEAWHPYINYTYADSRIKENSSDPLTVGKHVQRVSPHKVNLGATYAPTEKFYARVSGRFVDEYFFNDRNTPAAANPGYFVTDAKIGYRLSADGFAREAEISLAVNNLFGKKYKEQQYDYEDGRNVWLGLSAKF